MSTVRWGMIGCGSVTELKSGPAFYKAPGSALVAVMGRREDAVRDYASRHGIARYYTDAQALINDPEWTPCTSPRRPTVTWSTA
jgi:1,5-anhydro-D-fructose reductase (1,5-anhydro-D-mannitol-forming)